MPFSGLAKPTNGVVTLLLSGSFLSRRSPQRWRRGRGTVIRCLVDVALGGRVNAAAAALVALSTTLAAPRGPFGKGLDDNEVVVWQSEAEHVIECLMRIGQTAAPEVIRFLARRELRSIHQDDWPQVAPAVETALDTTMPVPNEPLYDLLIGVPWNEQLKEWTEEEARVERLCAEVAEEFLAAHVTPPAVVEALLSAMAALKEVGRETEPRTGQLVRALVLASPANCRHFVYQLVAKEMAWPLLSSALVAVHEVDPALGETMVVELSHSEAALVRVSVGQALQGTIHKAADLEALVLVTQTLSQDLSPTVRTTSAYAARRLAKLGHPQALSILVSIEWSGDLRLANEVVRSIDSNYGVDPSALSDADIDILLGRVERLRTLDGQNYGVLNFISVASGRRPRHTLEMLLRRILATDTEHADREVGQWIPLPHNGRGLTLPGISQAPNHVDLMRAIRDATLDAGWAARLWFSVLFQVSDPTLSDARVVLREWFVSGQGNKIVATATLLRGYTHNVIFSECELVAEILGAASECGSNCLNEAKGELFALAMGGVHRGAPGQPMPRHVQDHKEAGALVTLYNANEPVRGFYQDLLEHAEGSMRLDVELWEEEDD